MSGKRGNNESFLKSVEEQEEFDAEQLRRAAEFRAMSNIDMPKKLKKKNRIKKLDLRSSKKAIERKMDEMK